MNNLLINQLRTVAKTYPEVQSILLFGSRAHRDHTDLSDIDLAVKAPEISEVNWLLLADQVENKLDTLLKIDLVLYDQVSEALRVQIDECSKISYKFSGIHAGIPKNSILN